MDFLLTYGLGRMKHFSFVYFSMLLHDSEEGCSHFVLKGSLMELYFVFYDVQNFCMFLANFFLLLIKQSEDCSKFITVELNHSSFYAVN